MSDNPNADAQTTEQRTVPVEIISERWGSEQNASEQVIDVKMLNNNTARLDITIDLRKCSSITIRPIRRELDDIDGLVKDATRLANS